MAQRPFFACSDSTPESAVVAMNAQLGWYDADVPIHLEDRQANILEVGQAVFAEGGHQLDRAVTPSRCIAFRRTWPSLTSTTGSPSMRFSSHGKRLSSQV